MKNKIRGWKDVFIFSFAQGVKSKKYIITNIVLFVIALCIIPIIALVKGDEDKKPLSIETVYVVDGTGFGIVEHMDDLVSDSEGDREESARYEKIKYEAADIKFDNIDEKTKIKDIYKFDEKAKYVYLVITYQENGVNSGVIYSDKSKVSKDDVQEYSEFIGDNIKNILIKGMDIDEESMKIMESANVINVTGVSAFLEEIDEDSKTNDKNKASGDDGYWIIYVCTMMIMFFVVFAGERIAVAIITEKSSKVMEYLMTSVRPMAIVVGKTLANVLVVLIQFAALFAGFICSFFVNAIVVGANEVMLVPDSVSGIFSGNVICKNPLAYILAVMIIIFGLLFYAMIAAMAGASVSKLEDLSEGIKILTITEIISVYIDIFLITGGMYKGESVVKYIAMEVPFTSVFITPGALLTSNLGIAWGILTVVLQIIALVLLVKFVSNIYESMIYYNGNPMKLKDIFNISKNTRKNKLNSKDKEEKENE